MLFGFVGYLCVFSSCVQSCTHGQNSVDLRKCHRYIFLPCNGEGLQTIPCMRIVAPQALEFMGNQIMRCMWMIVIIAESQSVGINFRCKTHACYEIVCISCNCYSALHDEIYFPNDSL